MDKTKILEIINTLPMALVGTLATDSREKINLRDSCINMMQDVMEIVKPKEMLELGCHVCHSSALLLYYSKANLTSCDISHTWVTWEHGYIDWGVPGGSGLKRAKEVIDYYFPNRFRFIIGDSTAPSVIKKYGDRHYDLVFIDASHDYDDFLIDFNTALKLNVRFILVDDYNLRDGRNDARIAVTEDLGFKPLRIYTDIHNKADIGCALFENHNYK